jgi:hypothetical protein
MFWTERFISLAGRGLALLSLLAVSSLAEAQRKAPPTGTVTPSSPSGRVVRRARAWEGLAVSTEIEATFNGRRYDRTVEAQCEFDERASPGSARWQWNVLFPPFGGVKVEPAPLTSFALAIWNPAKEGATVPFSFAMAADGESPMIQTYGRPAGSGTVRIKRDGTGAKFYVSGIDARGRKISATIECSQVRKPEATGG